MKNHRPIQRHQALVHFSKDHHFGLLLVWKIRQGLKKTVEPERISNYVLYFFEEDLQEHFSEEEKYLFPKLPFTDPLRKQAEAEHEAIRALIDEIRVNKNNTDLLSRLASMTENHIRFEERILFNYIQSLLQLNQEKLELSHDNVVKKDIDAEWKDIFWITNRVVFE